MNHSEEEVGSIHYRINIWLVVGIAGLSSKRRKMIIGGGHYAFPPVPYSFHERFKDDDSAQWSVQVLT